jgi:hypothetical protein
MAKSILYSAILEAISGKDHGDLYEVIIEIELEAERIKTKKRVLLAGVMFIGAVIGTATVFFFSEKPRDPQMFRVMD